MGFMGLSNWSESDNAADFHATLTQYINSAFRKELKNEANEYNTPGWLNALLILKEHPSLVTVLSKDILRTIGNKINQDCLNGSRGCYLDNIEGRDLIRNFNAITSHSCF